MQDKKDFGQYIRGKREAAGLSQRELAQRLHVVESAVSKWERGLSYPDVSLVPDVCRELSISEHEFFMACDDEGQRRRDRASRRWDRVGTLWKWGSTISCAAAVVICFICDLAVCHALDWFWIVLTGVGLFWCLTTLPLWIRKKRLFWAIASGTGCLFLLLLACWLYQGGFWLLGGIAIAAISLALPWGGYVLARRRPRRCLLWCSAFVSVWLMALLAVIWLFTRGDWLFTLGWPIAGVCLVFYWVGLLLLRLPIGGLFKAALLCVWTALALPVGNTVPMWFATGSWNGTRFWSYFLPQRIPYPMEDLSNHIVFWVLIAAALALLCVGLAKRFSHDGK